MTRAELADGTILEFPDGTDPAVIDRVVKQHVGGGAPAAADTSGMTSMQIPANMAAPGATNVGPAYEPDSKLRSAAIGATQGASFGLGDEIASGIAATIGRPGGGAIPGATLGERYDNALKEARESQKKADTDNPGSYMTGQIAGGLAPALIAPEAFVAKAGATLPAQMGRGALAGGASGAAYGFGTAEGGAANRLQGAAVTGALGATAGAAVPAVANKLSGLVSSIAQRRAAAAAVPTNQALRAAGTAAYDAVENAGLIVKPTAMRALTADVYKDLSNLAWHPKMQPNITAIVGELNRVSKGNITAKGIDTMRKLAGNAAKSQDPTERMMASRVIEKIDDMMDNLTPNDVLQGDAAGAAQSLKEARTLWSRMRKSEMIDEAVKVAEDQAMSTNSGGNVQNVLRQKLRLILDNPKKVRGFSKAEQDALRKIVHGTPTQNTLRQLGRLAPSSNAWLGVLSTWAIPGGVAIPIAGSVSKALATRSTQKAIDRFSQQVRNGGPLLAPQAPAGQLLAPYPQQVIQRMLGQGVAPSQGGQ